MNIIGIIPTRMKSSRLPGKAMKKILNIPMIGHVYFRSKQSTILKEVYVATCDTKIKNYVQIIGGKVIMTSKNHKRAVDRTQEALKKISQIILTLDIYSLKKGSPFGLKLIKEFLKMI